MGEMTRAEKLLEGMANPDLDAKTKLKMKEAYLGELKKHGAPDELMDLAKKKTQKAFAEGSNKIKQQAGGGLELLGDAKGARKLGKTAGKFGKKLRSVIPGLGLLATGASLMSSPELQAGEVPTEDLIDAAVYSNPVTSLAAEAVSSDDLGPEKGSLEQKLEDPSLDKEKRYEVLKQLQNKYQGNM